MSSTRAFVKHLLAGHLASTVAGAGLTFGEAETRCLNPISAPRKQRTRGKTMTVGCNL